MNGECANWALCVAHLGEELPVDIEDLPRIAHLPAALGIERGAPNNQLPLFARCERRNLDTVAEEPQIVLSDSRCS